MFRLDARQAAGLSSTWACGACDLLLCYVLVLFCHTHVMRSIARSITHRRHAQLRAQHAAAVSFNMRFAIFLDAATLKTSAH